MREFCRLKLAGKRESIQLIAGRVLQQFIEADFLYQLNFGEPRHQEGRMIQRLRSSSIGIIAPALNKDATDSYGLRLRKLRTV